MMFNNVESLLVNYFPKHDPHVIAGVSGGPDSLVLLDILHKAGLPLIVAHLHHGLRPAADHDLSFVESEAQKRSLPFFTKKINVPELVEQTGKSIEEVGRQARYQFLFELARAEQAEVVAVGHTADDQVETILMHLLRGSGLEGLRGMQPYWLPNPWSTQIPLVRPLLGIWRSEILEYCKANKLAPVEDESNQDSTYFRNRLRNELIPYLSTYNPKIKRTIWKLGSVVTEDYRLLQSNYREGWLATVLQAEPHYIRLNRASFLEQPTAIQRIILRDAARFLNQDIRDIGFDLLERALQFSCSNRSSGKVELAQGLELELLEHELWICSDEFAAIDAGWPYIQPEKEIKLTVPGEIQVSPRWRLSVQWLDKPSMDIEKLTQNQDPYQAYLQTSQVIESVVIRTRRPGDRLHPLGMEGHSQKLSDYMVNVKIPRMARQTWPVVCLQNQIAWLPGFIINHELRVQDKTAYILHLVLAQIDGEDVGSSSDPAVT